jgi:hypothetical protein
MREEKDDGKRKSKSEEDKGAMGLWNILYYWLKIV